VLVRAYTLAGVFVTQQYSSMVGPDAVAEITLDGDTVPIGYTVRFSKNGVAFDGLLGNDSKSPQSVLIYSPAAGSPTGTNNFDIQGQTFTRPVATNPRLCRASGFFKDLSGRVLPGLDIKFINDFMPAVVDGDAILGEALAGRTDKDGYMQLDMYRFGKYWAWVDSIHTIKDTPAGTAGTDAIGFNRLICVPDQSSVNLVDLLFPIVSTVAFTPSGPVSVAVDATTNLTVVVTASDGRVLTGYADGDVCYTIADPLIAGVRLEDGGIIQIVGLSPGVTTLTVTRKDQTIVNIPNTPISGQPITITVT
jgi:hypothetical protein